MGVSLQRHVVARLLSLADSVITIGTACSGSDMLLNVTDALLEYWKSEFGVALRVQAEFACEREAKKQAFLIEQFGAPCIFQDVSELSGARATDVVSGQARRVPAVTLFASGFSCVSRSKLNNNRKKNVHCVQSQQGETRATYAGTVGYIRTYSPQILILENVVDLMQELELSLFLVTCVPLEKKYRCNAVPIAVCNGYRIVWSKASLASGVATSLSFTFC